MGVSWAGRAAGLCVAVFWGPQEAREHSVSAEESARDERLPWGPPPELGGRAFQAPAGPFLQTGVLQRAPPLSIWKVERNRQG